MSQESRRRWRELRQQTESAAAADPRRPKRRLRWLVFAGVVSLLVAGVALWQRQIPRIPANTAPVGTAQSASARLGFPPTSFAELGALSPDDVAKCDIALMNLLCAEGLRGSETLNVPATLARLDEIAAHARIEIERNFHRFREKPNEFNFSEGYYRMMMLATVLQQDFGIHYNPARITPPGQQIQPNAEFFANSQDAFIHGLTRSGGTGTCASMPVFYVAIGRRLGYPLKLVKAKLHLFVRWEGGAKSFNIEGTAIGFSSEPDDYYRQWPLPFTPAEEKAEGYLRAMTPTQELSSFLATRGASLEAAGDFKKALGAFAHAYYREPQSPGNQWLFARAQHVAAFAGVLPLRDSLRIKANELVLPPRDEPRYPGFAQELALFKARLAGNEASPDVDRELEADYVMLHAELARYQPPDPFSIPSRPKQPQALQLPPIRPISAP